MSKVSFDGIGAVVATFACEEGVEAGQVVKVTGQGTVGPCAAGDRVGGLALSVAEGYAAVQVKGFVTVTAAGELAPGWAALTADGSGGMQAGESGNQCLVAAADSGSAVVLL